MTELRQVRRAEFRAPRWELANRAAILFEDALRTASLPSRRLILVRKLDLGVIQSSRPPSAIALQMERRIFEWESVAVAAGSAGAADSPAVFFESPFEVAVQAAVRIARRQSLNEWYWPLALQWKQRGSAARPVSAVTIPELAHLAVSALAADGVRAMPSLAVSLFWRRLGQTGVEVECLGMMTEGDAEQLLELSGLPWREPAAVFAKECDPLILVAALRHFANPAIWGLSAMVRRWAAAMHCAEAGASLGLPIAEDPPRWRAAVEALLARYDAVHHEPCGDIPTNPRPAESAFAVQRNSAQPGQKDMGVAPASQEGLVEDGRTGTAPWIEPLPYRVPTAAGGLCFLIPVLRRLGFDAWVEAEETAVARGIPFALLRTVLLQCQLPEDDALFDALAGPTFRSPEVEAWILKTRLWLRRNAGMRLSSLVLRPASFICTDTHWDFYLPLSQAELRIRALGLDIDPGWVSFLGRVIRYRYEHTANQ